MPNQNISDFYYQYLLLFQVLYIYLHSKILWTHIITIQNDFFLKKIKIKLDFSIIEKTTNLINIILYFLMTYFNNIDTYFLYSFIMDWQERKQNYQKQPPDKKNKPKYVAKD